MKTSKFSPGQVISHKRYGYRGVIVDWDTRCSASDEWYQKNQTQPSREQPWYHVLVDGSAQSTYVAEENLKPDQSKQEVQHPLLKQFFASFFEGRYYKESVN